MLKVFINNSNIGIFFSKNLGENLLISIMNNLLDQDFANNWWFCSFLYLETVEDDAKN